MRGARGYSLVEVMVAIGLLSLVLLAFALTRSSGERQALDLDFRATALRTAQHLFSIVKEDFDNLRPDPAGPGLAVPVAQEEVSFTRFAAGELALDAGQLPAISAVQYRFDRARRRILRNGVALQAGPFDAVRFTLLPARQGGPPRGDVLRVEVELVPPEYLGREGKGVPRARHACEMSAIQGVLNQAYDRWD